MNILFMTYDLPFPLNSGGKIRAYYLMKSLSKKHQITLVSWYRSEDQKKYIPYVKKICNKVVLFKRRKQWSISNLVRSFVFNVPYLSATYHSLGVTNYLKKEINNHQYDVVHLESFYPCLYLPIIKSLGVKTLLSNENLEYKIYERYAKSRLFSPLQRSLMVEVNRMRNYEEQAWKLADYNIAISEHDAEAIEKITHRKCFVVPNGVDANRYGVAKYPKIGNKLIFIGTLKYNANADAMKFFLSKIYPLIKNKCSDIRFKLVSWEKPRWLDSYLSDPSIEYVADKKTPSSEILPLADIVVAPMRVASGTNIKILEAMAAGLPVVTTPVGAEGLGLVSQQNSFIENSPEDFAKKVCDLVCDQKERERVGGNGKEFVIRNFDWSKIGQNLLAFYEKIK